MTTKGAFDHRGMALLRLAGILCLALILYISRDFWLPQRQNATARLMMPFTPPLTARPAFAAHREDAYPTIGASPATLPSEDAWTSEEHPDMSSSTADPCTETPGARSVMLLLKTGATELYQKLPIHFLTTLRCVADRNFIIFSDMAQTFADHIVIDSLAGVGSEFRDNHADFDFYRKLQDYQTDGKDVSELKGENSWALDKWKFLPIFHATFEAAHPDTQWFVMIEADTSLSWTNLLLWLKTMDPQQPFYLGAQNVMGGTNFAHGGSGIVISRRALTVLEAARRAEGTDAYDRRWEQDTSEHCCGDEVLARAFLESNIPLTPAWPLLQGETRTSLDWTSQHWCTPAISWHHVDAGEIDALWQFERAWIDGHGWDVPYRFRDLFTHFIDPHVQGNRTHWNNLSKDHEYVNTSVAFVNEDEWDYLTDLERAAVESQDACAAACSHPSRARCVQWMYMPGRCYLGDSVRLGQAVEEEWVSGWVAERLEQFKDVHRGCRVRWSGVDDGEDR